MEKECVRDIQVADGIRKFTKNPFGIALAKEMIRNDNDFVVNTCLFFKLHLDNKKDKDIPINFIPRKLFPFNILLLYSCI